ncbi:MAG: rhodanese-like domain-containing protein [Balneolaceae bacterium]|nr:rhodanese-like domain-containing protein [Balneolaceae bacterium]
MSNVLTNEKVLVSTDWAADHLEDEGVRFVEIDVDTESYDSGHIPGAVGWNWKTQLQDQLRRTIASKEDFESLLEESGVDENTTLVLYGDNNNWFAAWAYWLLKYYGHDEVKILDGGRKNGKPKTES